MYFERVQRIATRDIVRKDYEVWLQEGIVCGRRGVEEFIAVVSRIETDVEGEGLVEIAEDRKRVRRGGSIGRLLGGDIATQR